MPLGKRRPQVIPAKSSPISDKKEVHQQQQSNHEERILTVTQRRNRRSTTTVKTNNETSSVKKTKCHIPWKYEHVNGMLAWISKNKDEWLNNKSKCIRLLLGKVIQNEHSEGATFVKLHTMERDFWSCFEFVSFVDKGQVFGPMRRVMRERVERFKFYKECRAAFGPPEYEQVKGIIRLKTIHGPPPPQVNRKNAAMVPSPAPQQDQKQHNQQEPEQPVVSIPKPGFIIKARVPNKEQTPFNLPTPPEPSFSNASMTTESSTVHPRGLCVASSTATVPTDDNIQEPMMEEPNDSPLLREKEQSDNMVYMFQKQSKVEEYRIKIQKVELKMKQDDLRFKILKAKRLQQIARYKKALKTLSSLTHSSSLSSTSRQSLSPSSSSSSSSSSSAFSIL